MRFAPLSRRYFGGRPSLPPAPPLATGSSCIMRARHLETEPFFAEIRLTR